MPLLLLLVLVPAARAQAPPVDGAGEYVAGLAAGLVWEQDRDGRPSLDGQRIAFTAFASSRDTPYGFVGSWFLERKRSDVQRIIEFGAEIAYPYVRISRVGLGPRARLALQHRAEAPSQGIDGVFGAGVEAGFWITERLQLSANADRVVGVRVAPRTTLSLNLRAVLWHD
ncbi:MAG: hypothetical protein JNL44_13165 [Gemmatimonadetes bacterium]|nr:hypothetical protein [Gemmatimonadota bacterium]